MEWDVFFKIVEAVFIPGAIFLYKEIQSNLREINEQKTELLDFKVYVAQTYATGTSLVRLESKIDELKDLIIAEKMDGYRKRA